MTSSAATRVWASRSGTLDTSLAYRADGYLPLPWHAGSRPVTAHDVCAACACVLGYACMYACVRTAWGRLAARLACGDHLAAELAAKAAKGKRRAQPAPAPAPAPAPTPAPAPARARAPWLLTACSLRTRPRTAFTPHQEVHHAHYRGISPLYPTFQSAAAAASLSSPPHPLDTTPRPTPTPTHLGRRVGGYGVRFLLLLLVVFLLYCGLGVAYRPGSG